ncbi:YbcC family protein [Aquifex pyrophilus]
MELGRKLYIRSLVNVSAEPISFFWPMRNFVHHNPLHELEHLPFEEAVKLGEKIFKGRPFLSRKDYVRLMEKGYIDREILKRKIEEYLSSKDVPVNAEEIFKLMSSPNLRPHKNAYLTREANSQIVWKIKERFEENPEEVLKKLLESVGETNTLLDVVDAVFGEKLNEEVNELLIKAVLDFLDEGQSVVEMPNRRQGFFKAWRELSRKNLRYFVKGGRELFELVEKFEEPEEVIDDTLKYLGIPEERWEGFLTLEIAKLKGFAGYIRWRYHNKHYYFQRVYPTDIVEFVAVRLTLERGLLAHRSKKYSSRLTYEGLKEFFEREPFKAYLMYEYHSRRAFGEYVSYLPEYFEHPEKILKAYLNYKSLSQAQNFALFLEEWLGEKVKKLSDEELHKLVDFYEEFKENEGFIWLKALEETAIRKLIRGVKRARREEEKPKAQALFCIDVRSERYRRNLEKVGNYETYGIAGFFGVPMAFVELHKGHEEFLCPVLIRPKNVVLEVPKKVEEVSESFLHAVEEILHDLKQNVLTPYITVEAIGFLFGFDFIGKTFMPYSYSKLRERFLETHEEVDYIINKLPRKEIERIVKEVYKITIKKVLKHEFGVRESLIWDGLLEEVYKLCMEEGEEKKELEKLGFDDERIKELLEKLKKVYRVDRGYRNILYERLSMLGFSVEEQAALISKALQVIGLKEFAPFIFIIGHGSKSDNNPYESALDCGACGGASGLYNAIVFCRMANNPEVRKLMRERFNVDIPENTYFIPALHNTTTDEVVLYETDKLPEEVRQRLKEIEGDLHRATVLTALERYDELFEENREEEVRKAYKVAENAYDWSQVRPEWGLSGNYAFVIGGRYLTKHLNLEGKVFLHSYDYRIDRKGFLLETILSGPMIVGQWINMEHYFSTTDNEVYGSGSKVYHNVAGRFGVVSGNFSDLRTGLPSQTVLKGEEPHHIPIRLIVLLEAPFEFATSVINRVYAVRELIKNGWVNFIIYDPEKGKFFRYEKEWKEVKDEEA